MKRFLVFVLVFIPLSYAHASEAIKGIIATYNNAEVSYKLEEVPTVKYVFTAGVHYAALYIKGQSEPIVSVPLKDGAKLQIVYGEYVPSAIRSTCQDNVIITDRGSKKYIQGGKLIIVGNDGKLYEINGKQIENVK